MGNPERSLDGDVQIFKAEALKRDMHERYRTDDLTASPDTPYMLFFISLNLPITS